MPNSESSDAFRSQPDPMEEFRTPDEPVRNHPVIVFPYLTFGLVCLTFPLTGHWILQTDVSSNVYIEFRSIVLYWSDLAILLFLVAVAVWLWLAKPPPGGRLPPLTVPLGILSLLALLSTSSAGNKLLAGTMAVRLAMLWLFFLALWRFHPKPRWVALCLAISLAVQSVVAIGQFISQQDLGWQWLGEIELAAAPGQASIITVGQRVWLRGYGLTPHPNILGGILVALCLALVPRFLSNQRWVKRGWLMMLALGAVALLTTFSRAAWLGGLAGGLVLVSAIVGQRAWRARYGRQLFLPLFLGTILVTVVIVTQRDLFLARFTPSASYTETRSLDERRVLTELSRQVIRNNWLLGIGAGNFSVAIEAIAARLQNVTAQPVHQTSFLLAAELGLAGGLLWLYLLLSPPWLAFSQWRNGRLDLWALGLTAGLVALAIIDLFDFYSWGWQQGRIMHWLVMGLWATSLSTRLDSPQSSISSGSSSYQ